MKLENSIKETLLSLHQDDNGYYLSCAFNDLFCDLLCTEKSNKSNSNYSYYASNINQDLWNLLTLAQRLNWLKSLWAEEKISDNQWFNYARLDIDLFHIELRSIFDYLIGLLNAGAEKKGQIKSRSFEVLRNWLNKSDKNRKALGSDLSNIVLNCDWFSDIRIVRDSIIHSGGNTIVFFEKEKILFQTIQGIKHKIKAPSIVYDNNVINFELYYGFYFTLILQLLNDVSKCLFTKLQLSKIGTNAKSYHAGLEVYKYWLNNLLTAAEKNVA